ncbi:protein translocase subunit SecD, partial [Cellulomonas endophytica]|uniref:protein translocase subunit SecD n=1 Tax=Cellulomonas endophytica TaxID=2494735 RepID=UPI001013B4AD
MAPPRRHARPARSLVGLAVLVVALFGALLSGTRWSDASFTPGLALDLEGGTQIILQPVTTDGSEVTDEDITQAIDVIRQRVDASGVAEAEITSQGGQNIVVALPGRPDDATLDLVKTSAQMEFRPVLAYGAPTPATAPTPAPVPTDGAGTEGAEGTDGTEPATEGTDPAATPTPEPTVDAGDGAATEGDTTGAAEPGSAVIAPAAFDTGAGTAAAATPAPSPEATPPAEGGATGPTSPSDTAFYLTPEVQAAYDALDCTDPASLTGGVNGPADAAFVTCSQDGTAKFVLGPVEVEGTEIESASSGLGSLPTGGTSNEWVVSLEFTGTGTGQFAATTERLVSLASPQNQFGIVLDGLVVSAPSINEPIPNGQAQISGTFTRDTAATLANQLNFGALPLTFEVQSQEQISATLGSEQLEKGLLAGLVGLALVVVYSLFQYRALGLLTVGSLLVAAVLAYGVIALLSWLQGYRLSLPGVAGLIVAIGITADSFIVYFERLRDELREGRTLGQAVDRAWDRARRTILASDAVNFLAAAVLYVLAVGGVRGFAFTLGLTTLIDLLVVFLFTHPMLRVISRWKFFAQGHPLSGLDPRRLGAAGSRYVGRGRFSSPAGSDVPDDVSALDGGADGRDDAEPALAGAPRRAADAVGGGAAAAGGG